MYWGFCRLRKETSRAPQCQRARPSRRSGYRISARVPMLMAPRNNKTTLSGGLVMLGKTLGLTILASLLAPVTSFAQGNQGRERHILELRWAPASGWSFHDLTSEIPAPVADSPGARPAGYVRNADSTQHVVYRGTDLHIYELWWGPPSSWSPGWHWGNLTGWIGAPTLAAGNPAGYVVNADGTQHVIYRGDDDHIYELWWDGTQCSQTTCWHWGDLTASSGAPTLAAGDPAGYVRNA